MVKNIFKFYNYFYFHYIKIININKIYILLLLLLLLYVDDETKFEISCKSCQTSKIFKSDDPNYCLFTEKSSLTIKEYEQYLNAMAKDNKKGKR